MRSCTLFLIAALLLVFAGAGACLAAEPTADDYVNFFKPLAGQWTFHGKMGDNTGEAAASVRISPTGRSVVSYFGPMFQYPAVQVLEGYDPETKKWKYTAFGANGDHTVAYSASDAQSLKGNKATFKFETVVAKSDGKKDKWQGDVTVTVGKDQWKQQFTSQTLNGEKQPDEEYVFERRRRRESPDLTPQIIDFFPGKWKVKDADGKEIGSVEWKRAAGRKVAVGAGTVNGVESVSMAGWDLRAKSWVHTWFEADGTHGRIDITSFADNVYSGRVRVVDKDGKAASGPCTNKVIDANHFEITEVLDGKTVVLRFERVK